LGEGERGGEVTLGASLALTGRYALQGRQAAAGLRLWARSLNAAGGLALGGGCPVRLVIYDDGSRAAGLEANLARLLDEEAVDVLFGPYGSDLALRAARLAATRGRILWNHAGASDSVGSEPTVVNGLAPASAYFAGLPRWLRARDPACDRLAILYGERGTFGLHVASGAESAARAAGLRHVAAFPFAPPLAGRPAALRAVREWRPHAVICSGHFEDDVWLATHRDELGPGLTPLAAVAAGLTAFGAAAGSAAEGAIGPSHWEAAVRPGPDGAASAAFAADFATAYGQPPEYPAALAYSLGVVLAGCAAAAGSLAESALRAAAAAMELLTPVGRFRLDAGTGRQIGYRPALVRWQGGIKRVVALPP
jgi:branched-chain amino acid transport system substrate-binding protein